MNKGYQTIKLGIHKMIKFRYLIALVCLFIGVFFQLHGSSLSNWNNFGVSETTANSRQKTINQFSVTSKKGTVDIPAELKNWVSLTPREDGTLVGVPRMIRTDEWMVQTPYFISQANTGNHLINTHYGLSGQNMILAYNAPVKDLSVIGKPANWGFIFLGAAYGLSWYWCFKIIFMLLLAFEFSMIITKKNLFISLIGSLWITFTPATQWWFMQHLGDVVFNSLAIMVFIYHYFRSSKLYQKIAFAGLLAISIVGFVLIIYPAFQVPFAYLILSFFSIVFVKALKQKEVRKSDYLIMVVSVLVSFSIIGYSLLESKEAIKLVLNTVYPGHRVSTGGELSWQRVSDIFSTLILPFKIPSIGNQVEAASSINFLFIIIFLLPVTIKKKDLGKNRFQLLTLLYSLFLAFYAIVGMPKIFAKLSLFSYVTSGRAWQSLAVISVFVSIWYISYLWNQAYQSISKLKRVILAVLSITGIFLVTYVTIKNGDYQGYIGTKYILVISLFLLLVLVSILYKKRLLLALTLLPLIVGSGMTVNPTVQGLKSIESKKLTVKLKKMIRKDPDSYWISEGILYNYPQMFGAHTLNSVRFYPDKKLMEKIDPNRNSENVWNRYAHIQVFLTPSKTRMEAPVPDVLNLQLNVNEVDRLNVRYLLTQRNLEEVFGKKMVKVYGPDLDGNRIYMYNK
ncbi:Uncharacterised protein [Streptococcus pseudoporcinus]|uniref:Uncharacterized protein n=2 Tax=Streptococcus pseudoporcinus TaxID=361101 RepID=A0A4U9XL04_9STRE|nr:Uncharacterised protein [Streptococcus pseudoporcinus]VUC66733.1 Uncharacterised protein [Streptococcus pseudoporcinus]VUC97662.1 Uncharacterised protein [Streptococcus pseudoporcinus]VUC98053.1 Uncharacterised protein [Streptococcus pseudoporcinus]